MPALGEDDPSEEKEANNLGQYGFGVVCQNVKVRWELLITAHTTDEEIERTATPNLLRAVDQVENN